MERLLLLSEHAPTWYCHEDRGAFANTNRASADPALVPVAGIDDWAWRLDLLLDRSANYAAKTTECRTLGISHNHVH
jgi:hypothetical protein